MLVIGISLISGLADLSSAGGFVGLGFDDPVNSMYVPIFPL
jgi:hypothetical protein